MSNRALIMTLGALLVVALMAIAFLLGRESDRDRPLVAVPEYATPDPVAPPRPLPEPVAPRQEAAAEPAAADPIAVEDDGTRLERRGGELTISNTEASDARAPGAGSAELAAYLDALADLEAGPTSDNPQAFAQDLAASAMGGDTSKLDSLARDIGRAQEKARAITAPAEAAAFHSQVIAQLGESREMIEQLSAAFQAKDPGALGKLVDRAKSLEDRAREIESAKKALERRAGR